MATPHAGDPHRHRVLVPHTSQGPQAKKTRLEEGEYVVPPALSFFLRQYAPSTRLGSYLPWGCTSFLRSARSLSAIGRRREGHGQSEASMRRGFAQVLPVFLGAGMCLVGGTMEASCDLRLPVFSSRGLSFTPVSYRLRSLLSCLRPHHPRFCLPRAQIACHFSSREIFQRRASPSFAQLDIHIRSELHTAVLCATVKDIVSDLAPTAESFVATHPACTGSPQPARVTSGSARAPRPILLPARADYCGWVLRPCDAADARSRTMTAPDSLETQLPVLMFVSEYNGPRRLRLMHGQRYALELPALSKNAYDGPIRTK
ncbi:hypothetical protein DFH09DRAFT_1500407 [Mycena vulgaris]|nr:hypothetical protein DFH09DRAFT_1500407 [Mycena vulgaris]